MAHGNLSVVINTEPVISQPGPFSGGSTVAAQTSQISVNQGGGALQMVRGGASLADVVKGLNSLGANPQDLVSILQAMKSAGALARRARDHLRAGAWRSTENRSGALDQRFALDVQGVDALRRTVRTSPEEGLKQVSRQFEALFMNMVLKSMREATPSSGLLDSQNEKVYSRCSTSSSRRTSRAAASAWPRRCSRS